jgi:integrase
LSLCGYQGVRQNAALHLKWADVDVKAKRLHWRAQWDKMGRAWSQPMSRGAVKALRVARDWQRRLGYTGPWVLPSQSSARVTDKGRPSQVARLKPVRVETYSQQALWSALQSAQERAGVAKKRGQGAHGLRRMLAGDVWEATGDALLALHTIGDMDPRMASRYTQQRDERISAAFKQADRKATVTTEEGE